MKKIFLAITLLFFSLPLFAERLNTAYLRIGRTENSLRIVFEADEALLGNAQTITTLSSIRIELPALFELKAEKDPGIEVIKNDRVLQINLKDVFDIKKSKLASPSRLVFDIKTVQKKREDSAQGKDTKTVQEPKKQADSRGVVQPDSKAQPDASAQQKQDGKPQNKADAKATGQSAQPTEKAARLKSFVVDSGHGGFDYGIISRTAKEKDVNLNVSKELVNMLTKKGLKAFLTRKVDQSVSIAERINLSNSRNPDLFISIHSSATDRFAIYVARPDELASDSPVKLYGLSARQSRYLDRSKAIAAAIGESVKSEFKTEVKYMEMSLPILTYMNSPAVVIEYPSLAKHDYSQKSRDKIIGAIVSGIVRYEQ